MSINSGNSAPLSPADAELITSVRAGQTEAFAELYHRHVAAARRLARTLAPDPSDADDLVAETFAKVLATLRDGGGPDIAFRAYLLTTLRHVRYDRARRDRRVQLTDDFTQYEPGVPFEDEPVADLDRSYAARAFAKLPERWRTVLWHTEVEGETPAQVAPLLGLTPNGVAALAYRARERLRQIYLQEHINDTGQPTCHWTAERLGAAVRGGLAARDQSKVDRHLDECPACRLLRAELAEVNAGLRVVLAPLVLSGSAMAYLGGPTPMGSLAALVAGWLGAPARQLRRLVDRYGSGNVAAAAGLALAVLIGSGALAVTLVAAPGPAPRPPRAAPPPPPPPPAVPMPPVVPTPPARSPVPLPPLPEPPAEPGPTRVTARGAAARPTTARLPVLGAVGLLSGRVAELPVTVRQPESSRLTLALGLPAGMSLHSPEAGDGWRCVRVSAGAECSRAPLVRGASSTARVRVRTEPSVTGFHRVGVRVTAGGRTVSAALPVAVAPPRTRVAHAVTGPVRAAMAGNTLLSCVPRPACLAAQSNDLVPMVPYTPGFGEPPAPAGLAPGTATSGARVAVPAGARIRWAGLFWSVSAAAGSVTVRLHGPGAAWVPVTAARMDRPDGAERPFTQAFAEVTTLVRGGTWWVAAPATALPKGWRRYAGWSLVVLYDDPGARAVDLAVYAGPVALRGTDRLALAVGGPSDFGLAAWDGEPGHTGDALLVGGARIVDNLGRGIAAGGLGPARTLGVDVATHRVPRAGEVRLVAGADPIEIGVLAVAAPAGTL